MSLNEVIKVEQGGSHELEALRELCSALARLFSYPTTQEAEAFTNEESVLYLEELAREARLNDFEVDRAIEHAFEVCSIDGETRARKMRASHTELFFKPSAPVPLEGRRWVRCNPESEEYRLGERSSVARCYTECGLAVRNGVTEREDFLASELDFVAFLIEQENRFRIQGSGVKALAWKQRRVDFCTRHLEPFVRQASAAAEPFASWSLLRLWLLLLRKAVARCLT